MKKNNLPAKTSKGIQRVHVRKYDSGKKVIVNPDIKKKAPIKKTTTYEPPRTIPRKQENNQEQSTRPKVQLKPRNLQSETQKEESGKKMIAFAELSVAAFNLPVITFRGQEDSFPEPIRQKIPIARFAQLMKDEKDFKEYATDEEALGYISTMSLIAPLDNEMVNVMTHLFNKVMPNVPEDLKEQRPLNSPEMMLLNRLKRSIRKSQWEQYKKRIKEEETNE